MGEKTEKGNAAFVGIGQTKRILIGDTLYNKFPTEEVEAVFAHELGHQVHGDLVKGIAVSSLLHCPEDDPFDPWQRLLYPE